VPTPEQKLRGAEPPDLVLDGRDMSVELNLWKDFLDSPIATDDHRRALDSHVLHTVQSFFLPYSECIGKPVAFVHQQ